jgi:excisionase family DNA binding protein
MHDTALTSAATQYLTVRQAAARLGKSPRAVYELISSGDLQAIPVRSRLRVSEQAITDWQAGQPRDEDLCEIGEAARTLQVHERTIAELILSGDLKAVKRHGHRGREIVRASLQQYLERAHARA